MDHKGLRLIKFVPGRDWRHMACWEYLPVPSSGESTKIWIEDEAGVAQPKPSDDETSGLMCSLTQHSRRASRMKELFLLATLENPLSRSHMFLCADLSPLFAPDKASRSQDQRVLPVLTFILEKYSTWPCAGPHEGRRRTAHAWPWRACGYPAAKYI